MSSSNRTLIDRLAVARRVVAGYASAPEQISRFLSKGRKRYLGDTIAQYDRLFEEALPPQVAASLIGVREFAPEVAVEGIGLVSGESSAEFVLHMYQAAMTVIRHRVGGRTADPSVPELIAAVQIVEPILTAWHDVVAHWGPLADQEFKRATAIERGVPAQSSAGPGRKVTPAKRALSAHLARFAHRRVGVRTLIRLASIDTKLHSLLRDTGCDPTDELAVRRVLEAALRWSRKHLAANGESGPTLPVSTPPRALESVMDDGGAFKEHIEPTWTAIVATQTVDSMTWDGKPNPSHP